MRPVPPALMFALALFMASSLWAEPVNPFARPMEDVALSSPAQQATAVERPVLRGLIFAGPNSIANLNGTLLSVGESFAGYQLDRVEQDSAIFLVNGKPVTLFVEEPVQEEGE